MFERITMVWLLVLLGTAAVTDGKTGKIPNQLIVTGLITGLVYSIAEGRLAAFFLSTGLTFFLSFLAFTFLRGMIGMGDLKLWMMASGYLGFRCSLLAFVVGQLLLLATVLCIGKREQVSFGIRMALIRIRPVTSERFSFGVWFFLGTVIVLVLKAGGVWEG